MILPRNCTTVDRQSPGPRRGPAVPVDRDRIRVVSAAAEYNPRFNNLGVFHADAPVVPTENLVRLGFGGVIPDLFHCVPDCLPDFADASKKFPASLLRVFAGRRAVAEASPAENSRAHQESRKFPVFSLLIRELAPETGSGRTAHTTTRLCIAEAPDCERRGVPGFRRVCVPMAG